MRRAPVAIALLSLLATPALAADDQAANDQAKSKSDAHIVANGKVSDKELVGSPDRVICRAQEQIGTRIGSKRVCATAAQWAARRAQERDVLDKIQTQNTKSN